MLSGPGGPSSKDEASEEPTDPTSCLPEGLLDDDEPLAYDEPMRLTRAVAAACILVDIVVPACTDRKDESSQATEQASDSSRASRPEPIEPDFAAYRRQPQSDLEKRQVARLIALAVPYYPQWDRDRESLNDYLTRYSTSPEMVRQKALVARRVKHDKRWRAFLADVRSALPANATVENGNPPFAVIPSYQIVVIADHPRGSIACVFRLSFLTSFYDYHENIRRRDGWLLETRLEPGREVQAIVDTVHRKIAQHYPAYHELPPRLGAILVPTMCPGNTPPDETTLADLLFEDSRRW